MEALPARAHPQAQRDGQCRRLLRQRRRRKNADPPWRQGLANVRKQDDKVTGSIFSFSIPLKKEIYSDSERGENTDVVTNLAKKLLFQRNRVTAVLTFNDMVANSVYKVAKETGIRIPEGLSVISFDDSDIARSLSPGLTTVRQPSYEKGYQAATRLLQQMDQRGTPVPSLTLPGLLVFRDSCSAPSSLLTV